MHRAKLRYVSEEDKSCCACVGLIRGKGEDYQVTEIHWWSVDGSELDLALINDADIAFLNMIYNDAALAPWETKDWQQLAPKAKNGNVHRVSG